MLIRWNREVEKWLRFRDRIRSVHLSLSSATELYSERTQNYFADFDF